MSQQDKTFMNIFIGVMVGLVVLFFVIFFIAQFVVGDRYTESAKRDPILQKQISDLLKPVGKVEVATKQTDSPAVPTIAPAPTANVPSNTEVEELTGEEIATTSCNACHATGAAGAPKIGDEKAWSARIEQGLDTLVAHAINGLNAMPPKGGNRSLTDEQVGKAVTYMTDQLGSTAEKPPVQPTAANTADGEKIYAGACFACHGTGAAGAPKLGDIAAWAARIEQGLATLLEHTIKGFNAMPPKGGRMDLDEDSIRAAVEYMVAKSQ